MSIRFPRGVLITEVGGSPGQTADQRTLVQAAVNAKVNGMEAEAKSGPRDSNNKRLMVEQAAGVFRSRGGAKASIRALIQQDDRGFSGYRRPSHIS